MRREGVDVVLVGVLAAVVVELSAYAASSRPVLVPLTDWD